jgi:hypothetical protein
MGKWKGDRDFTTRLECRGSAEMVSVICEIWEKSSGSTVWAVMLLFNFCVDYTDIHSHMLCDRHSRSLTGCSRFDVGEDFMIQKSLLMGWIRCSEESFVPGNLETTHSYRMSWHTWNFRFPCLW